jgi:transcriptional regulator with XRE-family HTH domain
MVDLGHQIRQLRKARGWSAQRLADETGGVATRSVIADLEIGRRKDLYLMVAVAVAKAFELTVEQLIDEEFTTTLKRQEIEQRLADLNVTLADVQRAQQELQTELELVNGSAE